MLLATTACTFWTSQHISTSKSGPRWSETVSFSHFRLGNVPGATAACTFFDISTPKSGPRSSVNTFDFETCSAPQWRALFSDILNSKSGPRSSVFNTFDFEMCFLPQRRALSSKSGPRWSETVSFFHTLDFETCFAPQRRAFFPHLNFQKRSETVSF